MSEHTFKVGDMVRDSRPMKISRISSITGLVVCDNGAMYDREVLEPLTPVTPPDQDVVEQVVAILAPYWWHGFSPNQKRKAAQSVITALTSSGYTRSKPDVNQMMLETKKHRSIEAIQSDLSWKHERLHDSQDHHQIVGLEKQIEALQDELKAARLAIAAGSVG